VDLLRRAGAGVVRPALGASLLREAVTARAELDLASYDRFFPAPDFLPKGSFGNLIALPLQGACRHRGTTVFLNPTTLGPWPDQWAFLGSLPRLAPQMVDSLVDELRPIEAGPGSKPMAALGGDGPAPPRQVRAELGAMLAIERFGLPPALVAELKHLASLHNPPSTRRSGCGCRPGTRLGSSAATRRPSTGSCSRVACSPTSSGCWPMPAVAW
jgi:hypothetical protein